MSMTDEQKEYLAQRTEWMLSGMEVYSKVMAKALKEQDAESCTPPKSTRRFMMAWTIALVLHEGDSREVDACINEDQGIEYISFNAFGHKNAVMYRVATDDVGLALGEVWSSH